MGLGTVGVASFLLGLFAWYPRWIFVALAVVVGVDIIQRLPPCLPQVSIPSGLVARVSLATMMCVMCTIILAAAAPPMGSMGHDGIAYHLLGPVVWERAHRIVPALDHSHTAFPALIETLFAIGMGGGGDTTPGMMGVFFLVCLLLQTHGLALHLGVTRTAAWIVTACVATMPAFVQTTELAFVDIPFGCFVLAALRLALIDHVDICAVGVFAGFTLATKYTGLFSLSAVLLAWAVCAVCSGARLPLQQLGTAGALAVMVGCPWWIRNQVVLGCAVYPAPPGLSALVPVEAMSPAAGIAFHTMIADRGKGLGTDLLDLLLLPFNLTYFTSSFHGAGGVGLVPLAGAPLGLASVWRTPRWRGALAFVALATVMWFGTQQEARFLVAPLVVFAVLAGAGIQRILEARHRRTLVLMWVLVVISWLYGVAASISSRTDALRSATSDSAAEARRQTVLPWAGAFDYLNSHANVQKVLITSVSVPPFFLKVDYVKTLGPYQERPLDGVTTDDEAIAAVNPLGISHVLATDTDPRLEELAKQRGWPCVFSSPSARVYEVTRMK
jgi:hypothetical protein